MKEELRSLLGYKLSKSLFDGFDNPNNRLIIGVACLKDGYEEKARHLLESIIQEGPKEHRDHHFAYVRSLVEIAELRAKQGNFIEAEHSMRQALISFPDNMGYMMSRVHLEVYLAYYCFYAEKRELAYEEVERICIREQEKFLSLPLQDACELVGPGLRYAIHQWALFYVEEGEWQKAVKKLKEAFRFMVNGDELTWVVEELEKQGEWEQAFLAYEKVVS